MQSKYAIYLVLCLLAIVGCSKYETQYEGPYSDADNTNAIEVPNEILVVQNGKALLFNRRLKEPKQLENAPAGVEKGAINFAHDRIACWARNQDIVLLDSSGVLLGTVPNSAAVDWFEWHPNNQTLVMLADGVLSQYGPEVALADDDLNDAFPPFSYDKLITCFAVRDDGTLFFNYEFGNGGGIYNRIGIKKPEGAEGIPFLIQEVYPTLDATWMRLNPEGNDLAFGGPTSFEQVTYRFTYPGLALSDWGKILFYAYSPDASADLYIYENRIEYENGGAFYFDFDGNPVSALDW